MTNKREINKVNKKRRITKKKPKQTNQQSNFKIYVFDLDNTLFLHNSDYEYTDDYHKRVMEFLQGLKARGKILCIATHNKNPEYYLKRIRIFDLFDYIIHERKNVNCFYNTIEDYTGKNEMIEEILDLTKCKKEEVIFFDDADYNIKQVEMIGVKSVKVCDQKGINFDDV